MAGFLLVNTAAIHHNWSRGVSIIARDRLGRYAVKVLNDDSLLMPTGYNEKHFSGRLDVVLVSFRASWNKLGSAGQAPVGLHFRFAEFFRAGVDRQGNRPVQEIRFGYRSGLYRRQHARHTSLLAGDLSFTEAVGTSAINGRIAGGDIAIVNGVVNTLPYYIVVKANIKSREDLKGRTAAVHIPGTGKRFARERYRNSYWLVTRSRSTAYLRSF